jgi:hypothetical protein
MTRAALTSLIPASGIQFLDVDFDVNVLPRISRPFWDERPMHLRDAAGDQQVLLRALEQTDAGELFDPVGRSHPPEDEVYRVSRAQALEPFLGQWVPLPYLRVQSRTADGAPIFDDGPTNWARLRVVELPPGTVRGATHRAVLAFDTALLARRSGLPYAGPSPEDAAEEQEFGLAARMADNAAFLAEGWFGQWLEQMFLDMVSAQRRGQRVKAEDLPNRMEPFARYLTLLELLGHAGAAPRVKLVDAGVSGRRTAMVDVDLLLDIGNARTCGILVESAPDGPLSLNDSYPLALRDLTRPEQVSARPFESRVEFSRAVFGQDALSRRSGRASAFAWPSPLRVGPEAVRLAGLSVGNEGATGLSSPKRYLWDERPSVLGWRFGAGSTLGAPGAGVGAFGTAGEQPVSGAFMNELTETGELLSRNRNATPAVRARFSRSSLYTLMLAEILLQAICQINAPATRGARRNADVPRRLRRVTLTLPTAMPVAEQRIVRRRAEHAVELVWAWMGWAAGAPDRAAAAPVPPRINASLDEATATQLVWLYAESVHRLQADPRQLFGLMGRVRDGGQPSLRIASIDIGGGTSDLAVTTYALAQDQEIRPTQNFREGFKIAGDDLLQAVIERAVLPPLEQALGDAGLREPKAFLRRVLGGARGGQAEADRQLTRQFVARVLEPCALELLGAYEALEPGAGGAVARIGIAQGAGRPRHDRAIAFFERLAHEAGAASFRLDAVEVAPDAGAMDGLVRGTLGPILADLCEATHAYDCDVLLLSGRPSRLRAVMDIVLAKLPVPAHRIVHMQGYPAGGWYPFRDAHARIEDPKTTAAVGAMVAALAEGSLAGFLLRASRLGMKSTARYIGRLETSGQLLARNEYLRDVNLDADTAAPLDVEIPFEAPCMLGFRQLPIERWPATPIYALEFGNADDVRNLALPLTVRLTRGVAEAGTPDAEASKEQFKPTSIRDAEGQERHPTTVRMRLQTMRDESGYWRDTGALGVP